VQVWDNKDYLWHDVPGTHWESVVHALPAAVPAQIPVIQLLVEQSEFCWHYSPGYDGTGVTGFAVHV